MLVARLRWRVDPRGDGLEGNPSADIVLEERRSCHFEFAASALHRADADGLRFRPAFATLIFTCIARTSLGREGRHGVLSLFELFELERWKTACFDAACSQADVAKLQQEMRRSMPIRYSAGKAASDKEVRLRSIACGIVREWVRSSGVSLGVGRAYATGRAPVL
jgi:hypothetical protein